MILKCHLQIIQFRFITYFNYLICINCQLYFSESRFYLLKVVKFTRRTNEIYILMFDRTLNFTNAFSEFL